MSRRTTSIASLLTFCLIALGAICYGFVIGRTQQMAAEQQEVVQTVVQQFKGGDNAVSQGARILKYLLLK